MANVNSDYEHVDIFGVALHWLCLNASQPLKQLDWPMSKDNAVQDVQLLLKHVDTYWPRILNAVNTEEKLITFLNDIDNYPKKTPAKGPISGDPNVYSAFYSLKIGNIKEAQKRIEIAYEQQIKRDKGLFFDDKEALASCKAQQDRIYAKYREEINKHV